MGGELARCLWVCEPAGAAVDNSRWQCEHQGSCPGPASAWPRRHTPRTGRLPQCWQRNFGWYFQLYLAIVINFFFKNVQNSCLYYNTNNIYNFTKDIFSFFDMMTISKWKIYFANLMFPRTNSIKFLFWCLIVLWMDGRRILNCKIARAKCKDWSFVQLLFNSNDDYQYTSTEFEWLLDMVNYTLQVTRISSVNFSL